MPNYETNRENFTKKGVPNNLFERSFELPNPGLRAYFGHVVQGQPDEYRTPFYRGKALPLVLQEWIRELQPLTTQWPSLYDFEIDLASKVGPMSIQFPLKDRMSDIDSYYDLVLPESEPISEVAINAVKKEWARVAGIRKRGLESTVASMKKSTNSGSPYFTKRRSVTHKTIPCEVWQNGEATWQTLGDADKQYNACAVLGWRGQEGGPKPTDVKQRCVWMFPYAVNIQELQVYQPLIEAFQYHNLVPAWVGMDAVDVEVTRLFDTKKPSDLVICTDFSKFDQHFNVNLQAAAEELIFYLFNGDRSVEGWLREVFPIKYQIPLAYDWGIVRTGKHGMGSGSGGTNADETLAHRCLQHEAALLQKKVLNPHSQCLGDDGILSYPGCSVDDVMQAYCRHGLEMNQDKQYASTQDCVYLRRWHHKEYREGGICVGVYSTCRALGRLAEQERYYDPEVWGPKMVALRQLSILENVKYHPLKTKFVDFCMKGDKFRLGLDIPGFLDNIEREAQKAIDYMPDFLGYTKSISLEAGRNPSRGISEWWIVRYLKSML